MRTCIIGALLAVLLTAQGCIYHTTKAPLLALKDANYKLTTEDFQILGTVSASGTIRNVLFLVWWGGNGFAALEEKAKAMGGDDIINYTFDVESTGILLLVYNAWTWRARGTVIKYRDSAKN
ncbi:MAG TPA: hypothetical protein PLG31_00300 [Spirochaetota bacterium]|nr:hypothetical protein [Spirochaetota bacterium]